MQPRHQTVSGKEAAQIKTPPGTFLTPDFRQVTMHASQFFLSYWVGHAALAPPL